MWRKFWTCAIALLFIICLASVVDAQTLRPNANHRGLSKSNSNGNPGNGNQGNNPGNGNQGNNPGNGNQGDNPGNGNRGENPGNGNQGENPGNGNQGENPGNGNRGENRRVNPGHGTPDGQTPAEEDICDDLKYATPGLYGLCIAFCEAQDSDCEPVEGATTYAERYANCSRRDGRILDRYERRRQDGDPEMPCLPSVGDQNQESACPCWGQDQLQYYPFYLQPYAVDETYFSSGIDEDESYWDEDDNGDEYLVCEQTTSYISEASVLGTGGVFNFDFYASTGDCDGMICGGSFGCDGDGCPEDLPSYGYFSMDINQDEYNNCVASIDQLINY